MGLRSLISGVLVLPLLFLRYGNIIAVAQSALLIALPIATAGLALSHAKVPASYVSFSIHDKVSAPVHC